MRMDIQCQGFTLTPGLEDYVRKRLGYTLGRAADVITGVRVRLDDINGPRGGADKRCRLELRLKSQPSVIVEDVEADLYLAIDRATDRASRTLDRRLDRRRRFAALVVPEPDATA